MIKKLFTLFGDGFRRGVIFFIPLSLTYIVVSWLLNLISKFLYPVRYIIPSFLLQIPYIEIICGFLLIACIGALFTQRHLKYYFHIIEESIIKKIPLISGIYNGIKKVCFIVFKHGGNEEVNQQVAWVRIPHKNMYCLGFMTGELPSGIRPFADKKTYSFFIPHTPNPITGYYVVAEESECIFTNLTRQEALSMVISGGVIKPERNSDEK